MSKAGVGKLIPGRLFSLEEIMRKIEAHAVFLTSQMLGTLAAHAEGHDSKSLVPAQPNVLPQLKNIKQNLEACGLRVSLNMVETVIFYLQKDPPFFTFGQLKGQVLALQEAIYAELKTVTFFRVDEENAAYFHGTALFGQDVALKFPTASFDIEEGGKSLALGRPTACVFHMMRTMEVGLKALAKELKIPYAPSWESYIKQIESNITAKHKSKSKKWKAIEPFYRDVLGNLISIKISWRNPTMHIVRNYTPTEAEDVLRSVRTFMQRLSERLSQA